MYIETAIGILIPFIGTTLGAACVFFLKQEPSASFVKIISGFAAGVMIAASVWSLLLPAMEYESALSLGRLAFLPATIGLLGGIFFLLFCDRLLERIDKCKIAGKLKSSFGGRTMLFMSVSLHNLPEGMAVGAVYAAFLVSPSGEALAGALALSVGIAIQNFPEGAIVSMPLSADSSSGKAFLWGVISGVIEPLGAALTLIAASHILPILPYLLGFAAGAMIFAVIVELMPTICSTKGSYCGVISFGAGFSFMMILDILFA